MQSETLQRRMFYVPSFKIYGAVAGFYDYGPPGCAVKQNLTALWRKHFILEENMLEVGLGFALTLTLPLSLGRAHPTCACPCLALARCVCEGLGSVMARCLLGCAGRACTGVR